MGIGYNNCRLFVLNREEETNGMESVAHFEL